MPGCKDPKGCREKAEHLRVHLTKVLPVAEERWERIRSNAEEFNFTNHILRRMKERAISKNDIMNVCENTDED